MGESESLESKVLSRTTIFFTGGYFLSTTCSVVVSCGVVRCGVVSCRVVRCGVVSCRVVRCGVVW